MFRESEVVESKPIRKVDPTASARSSIRRQRSVRYPPHLTRDRQLLFHAQSHQQEESDLERLRLRERERARRTVARSNAQRAYNIELSANQAHAEASRQRRLESGRAILRDALSYEHPHESMNLRREHSYALSMMRPPTHLTTSSLGNLSRHTRHRPLSREAALEERTPPYRIAMNRTPPPAYIPSPPYTSGERSNRSSPDVLQLAHGAASLTPRFAPAHPLNGPEAATEQAQSQHHPLGSEDMTASDSSDELPPLQRFSRRHSSSRPHRNVPPHNVVDGLGDRWRSVSPDDESWETLLSTMPPDERLPSTSASSSFRSNEESIYYQNSSNSAETLANVTDSYPHVCDNSDFSETDDDAMRTLRRLGGESYSHAEDRFLDDAPTVAGTHRGAQGILGPETTRQRQALRGGGNMPQIGPQSGGPQRHRSDDWQLRSQRREMGRTSRERL